MLVSVDFWKCTYRYALDSRTRVILRVLGDPFTPLDVDP